MHVFVHNGTSWQAPAGMIATLEHPSSQWKLTLRDRSIRTFDSSGRLVSVTDRNGNVTTYSWTTTWVKVRGRTTYQYWLTVTAPNLQTIVVEFEPGTVTISKATYTTSAGTRTVTYTAPAILAPGGLSRISPARWSDRSHTPTRETV